MQVNQTRQGEKAFPLDNFLSLIIRRFGVGARVSDFLAGNEQGRVKKGFIRNTVLEIDLLNRRVNFEHKFLRAN
jgi:hypothetical protein